MICGTREAYRTEVGWEDIEVEVEVACLSAQETQRGRLPLSWHNSIDFGEVFDIAGWMQLLWKAVVFLAASWECGLACAVSIMWFQVEWPNLPEELCGYRSSRIRERR